MAEREHNTNSCNHASILGNDCDCSSVKRQLTCNVNLNGNQPHAPAPLHSAGEGGM